MSLQNISGLGCGKKILLLVIFFPVSFLAFSQVCPFTVADFADGGTFSGTCDLTATPDVNTLTITGDVIWTSGTLTINDVENELAGLIISGTGSLTIQGGTVFLDDQDDSSDDSNIVVQAGGSLTIETGATLSVEEDIQIDGSAVVESGAVLQIVDTNPGGEVNVGGTLDVSGTVITEGTGAAGNVEADGGTITVRSGGLLTVDDDLKAFNGGTVILLTGSTANVDDNVVTAAGGTGAGPSQGTFVIDGTLNVGDNLTIIDTTPDSGLSGGGTITVGENFNDNEMPAGTDFVGCMTGVPCMGGGTPLPVEFLFFNAQYNNRSVLLEWATATEITNSHFEVERSLDAINFTKIAEVAGAGDSQQRIDYSYVDHEAAIVSEDLYYRLRQVDFDGQFEYSNTVVTRSEDFEPLELLVRPTLFSSRVTLTLNSVHKEEAEISLYDLRGLKIFSARKTIFEGINDIDIEQLDGLAQGTYIVSIRSNALHLNRRIVKTF